MSTTHELPDARRRVALNHLEVWLARSDLFRLYVDKIQGRGANTSQRQVDEIDREFLDSIEGAEAVLGYVLDAHGSLGGKLSLRAEFRAEGATADQATTKRHALVLASRREAPGAGRGAPSAVEGLAAHMSAVTAGQARVARDLHDRLDTSNSSFITHLVHNSEQRFSETLQFTSRINQLEIALATAELRADLDRQAGWLDRLTPEALADIVSEIAPHVGEGLGLVLRYLRAVVSSAELDSGIAPSSISDGDVSDGDPKQ